MGTRFGLISARVKNVLAARFFDGSGRLDARVYVIEYMCEVDVAANVAVVFVILDRCGGARTVISLVGMLFLFGSEMVAKPRTRLVLVQSSQIGWFSWIPMWK